jgi:zinc protease
MHGGKFRLGLFLIGSALAVASVAEGRKDGRPEVPNIVSEKYRLANGLEVILAEDHRLPVVAVNVWYHVGPANEEPGRTGFAHLFEHMMFQGSKHVAGKFGDALLERAGASNMNGTTDFDRTNYYETVPSNQLELALWLESDRMGYLLEQLDQRNLSNQQDVVRNERRQNTENRPYGIVEEALFGNLFPASHPYHADVIGSHADIQAAQLEDVRNFYRRYYAPHNATVAVAGDFDKAQAHGLVAKYFGALKNGAQATAAGAKTRVSIPRIASQRRAVIHDHVELERVDMAWITPLIFRPGDAEADLAAFILGGGRSSRLYKKLVYQLQIAQGVSARHQGLTLGSVFQLQATARPGHTAAELEKAIDEEMERFRREGPTEAELEGARNSVEARMMTRLETLNGVADRLNYYNHYLGKPDFLAQDLERYRKVKAATLRRFAEEHLKTSARVVVYCLPGQPDLGPDVPATPSENASNTVAAESVNADEPWRKEVPKPGASRPLELPAPQTFELANGMKILLAARPGMPMVAARLVVRTGSDSNPLDRPGLASFTAAMLDQGTASRSALQIADEAERMGATLERDSTMDASYIAVRSLKKSFPAALSLLADVVLHPSFPPEEIARQRANRLASLVQLRANAAMVADQVMSAALYGPRHPYGYPEMGTEESIRVADREDLLAFWKKSFVPNNAALVVAGDISSSELQALAEKELGAWQSAATTRAELGSPAQPAARLVLVDKPGAAQTQLRVGLVGAPRSTPDFAALEIMNASLGGLFSSRINLNLREEKGYTYGAYSNFAYRRSAGPFQVRTGVRTDSTAPAVTEIFKEIRRMAESSPSSEELTLAKNSQVLSLPGRFETTSQMVASFSNVYVYDLGLDYFTRLPALLSGVDSEAVRAAARKYLVPEKMVVVAVGDRARIEPELAPLLTPLALGAIEIRDADGRVKKE